MRKLTLIFFVFVPFLGMSQTDDSLFIRSLYDEVLTKGECYENLRSLCKDIGNRLSGSENAEKAVKWGEKLLKTYNFDRVYLQEVMVPVWIRGEVETCTTSEGKALEVAALGGSIGTNGPLTAEVVEINSFEQLEAMPAEKIKGKIVFYNVPMEPKFIRAFKSYGGCYQYRSKGPSAAAKKGAVATVLRSLSHKHDHVPHTGMMRYEDGVAQVPCAAIGTADSDDLSAKLKKGKQTLTLNMTCESKADKLSYNVIGEMKGSEFPDEYIVVGGHLDSWDLGEGAHDDGAGIVHSIEAARLLQKMNYKPKRTIRCVLYMNEENGNRGGIKYAAMAKENGEKHVAAIESDRGGFTPRGFTANANKKQYEKLLSWKELLEPYDLSYLVEGYAGVDIGPLKTDDNALFGFVPDSQRYFDFHHAPTDVFEAVNKRELELGAGSVATLLYLIDKYGM